MTRVIGSLRLERPGGDASLTRRLTVVTLAAATVLAAHAPPLTAAGRPESGYLALVAVATAAWLAWAVAATSERAALACLVVLAGAGGLLAVASNDRDGVAAALIFAAVAAGAAAQRFPLRLALVVAATGTTAILVDATQTPAAVAFAAL